MNETPNGALAAADFNWVRALLRDQAAIVLEDGKQYLVEARLSPLARREGCASVGELIARVRGARIDLVHRRIVEAMTINETSFFRDWRPFEALRKTVLPELLRARATSRQLRFWSAACSSGQEPFSLAILLREHFPQLTSWSVKVIATDLSTEMIERARSGRFPQVEVNRGVPAPLLLKYFVQHGIEWTVRDDVRRMVEFMPANLAGDWPALPPMDVVLLRNVLIYFDCETKKRILARVREVLKPGGLLFLGAAETTLSLDPAYERIAVDGTSAYRVIQGVPGLGPAPAVAARTLEVPRQERWARVLLVEDDEQVRRATRTMLARHGHQVIEAACGSEALKISEQELPRIDVLLTDLMMPQMSGGDLASRLTALRPDLPVIYMSGYTGDSVMRQRIIRPNTPFMQKPFTREVLLDRVAQVTRRGH
jgi:chemotaxis protein methyltransferase CheR